VKTIQELIQLSTLYLQERKVERARRNAEELLSHILGLKRIDLYLQFDRPVEEKELARLREWLKRLAKGEPLEYITGEVQFFGCRIKVDPRALIPRTETEILADLIAKRIQGKTLWDLCTGPGTLGLSLKKALPHMEVSLSDISPDALALARDNARENGVEVEFLLGDLLAPFAGKVADAVVCNPPYISIQEYIEIAPSVRDYEPKGALVGGERGTEFYERLAAELPPFLKSGGQLFLEIGAAQGVAVKEIFQSDPWVKLELLKDWSGKDRFFFLEKQ
jgi:release factor glutamine methyltransferase